MTNNRILIVEDNTIVAHDIQRQLEELGYTVSSKARSGAEAIQHAMEDRPDLVLMDIKLRGGMDGIEAAGLIRERFDVPIVYLTAYADEKTLSRAKITEPFGYIIKPFDENALHTNIQIGLFKHGMEQKLRENERWLATTLQCIGYATVATDAEGRVRLMNPLAERLTGWAQEEAFAKSWNDVVEVASESTGQQVTFATSDLRQGVVNTPSEDLVLRHKDGSEVPIYFNATPIVDDRDLVYGIVMVFRDVSERKVALQALEQSHNLLHLVLEGVSDTIFLKNLDGYYILMNKAGTTLLGSSEADILGKSDFELFGPGTAHLMAKGHERAVQSGKVQTFECFVSHGGEERTLLVSEGVCRGTAGNPVGVVGIGRDITEVEIGRRPLHQKEKLAETGRAVGTLAHEMGASLSGLRESFDTIKNLAFEEQAYARNVSEIEEELAHIAEITRQMSDLYWQSRSRRN